MKEIKMKKGSKSKQEALWKARKAFSLNDYVKRNSDLGEVAPFRNAQESIK